MTGHALRATADVDACAPACLRALFVIHDERAQLELEPAATALIQHLHQQRAALRLADHVDAVLRENRRVPDLLARYVTHSSYRVAYRYRKHGQPY